jgi:hypothetical protein
MIGYFRDQPHLHGTRYSSRFPPTPISDLLPAALFMPAALEDRMRRFLTALLGFLLGYPVLAFLGYWAILLLSNNHHDGSVEASMTAAFVVGPAGAVAGLVAGIILGKKKRAPS